MSCHPLLFSTHCLHITDNQLQSARTRNIVKYLRETLPGDSQAGQSEERRIVGQSTQPHRPLKYSLHYWKDHKEQSAPEDKNRICPHDIEHVEHLGYRTCARLTALYVSVSNHEQRHDTRQRRCSAETSDEAILVQPVASSRTRERVVPTALCRAGIELHEPALCAHAVAGNHRVRVLVAAEDVVGGGRGERVEGCEEEAVFLVRSKSKK